MNNFQISNTIVSFPLPPEDILEMVRRTVGKRHFNLPLVEEGQTVKFRQPLIGYGKQSEHCLIAGKSGAIICPNEGVYLGINNNKISIQVSEKSLETLTVGHYGVSIYSSVYEIVRYFGSKQTRADWIHDFKMEVTEK